MSASIKILVACHKPFPVPENGIYLPIQVGKALSSEEIGFQGDDEGDNISSKNPYYCELTALYWAWKNLKETDIVGLCHYRRYFDFHRQGICFMPDTSFPVSAIRDLDFSIDSRSVERIMKGAVVVPRSLPCASSLHLQYCEGHISDDFRRLEDIIKTTQPVNYAEAFRQQLMEGFRIRPYNMMIMRRQDFDDYCSWLFDILSRVEEQVDISHYSSYQQRIFGFMSERLFGVWLSAENKQLIERPVIYLNEKCSKRFPHRFAPRKTVMHYLREWRCAQINWLYKRDLKYKAY